MSLTTKQLFVNQTPLKNQNQELCLHRKIINVTTETSPMVACDLCKEWYLSNCIELESAFTHAILFLFVVNASIVTTLVSPHSFILSINDFYHGKAKTVADFQ